MPKNKQYEEVGCRATCNLDGVMRLRKILHRVREVGIAT